MTVMTREIARDLYKMYSEVEKVNRLLCIPSKEWTEEERKLVESHYNRAQMGIGSGVGGYYYPTNEELESNDKCEHEWEEKFLLTSSYKKCTICGVESD